MLVLIDLVRSRTSEYVNSLTTGLRLGRHLECATCSLALISFTIHVLGKNLSYIKLYDSREFNFVALRLLYTAYKHRKQSCHEHVEA